MQKQGLIGKIVHVQPLSLVDYPGKLAAVLFFAGCNLRCPFCHNSELVLSERMGNLRPLDSKAVLEELSERAGFLDGVVLTGGEPTLSPELPDWVRALRDLGFLVKLDTNGTQPRILAELLQARLLDYVALDIKAPFARYPTYAGPGGEKGVEAVRTSLALLLKMAPDHEVRTTGAPGLSAEDLLEIAWEIRGVKRYALQPFVAPQGKRLVDESWRARPHLSPEELRDLVPRLGRIVPTELRA